MRILIFTFVLFPGFVFSDDTCYDYKTDIEKGHHWEETDLVKENALDAIETIRNMVSGKSQYDPFEFSRAEQLVRGYLLKRAAIESKNTKSAHMEMHRDNFCKWLTRTAIYD